MRFSFSSLWSCLVRSTLKKYPAFLANGKGRSITVSLFGNIQGTFYSSNFQLQGKLGEHVKFLKVSWSCPSSFIEGRY